MKKTPNKGGVYIACADGLLLGSLNYSNSAFIMLPKTPNNYYSIQQQLKFVIKHMKNVERGQI